MNPTIAAAAVPERSASIDTDECILSEFSSMIKAPTIAGIDNKNEYLAEFSRLIPNNSATDMVEPDLETPGKIAIPWTRPMVKACPAFIRRGVLPSGKANRVVHKKMPVITSMTPTIHIFTNS